MDIEQLFAEWIEWFIDCLVHVQNKPLLVIDEGFTYRPKLIMKDQTLLKMVHRNQYFHEIKKLVHH